MKWKRIKAGLYESFGGRFIIERDLVGEVGEDFGPEAQTQEEWFLYDRKRFDQEGNMIDGYPTLKQAKKQAETILGREPSDADGS